MFMEKKEVMDFLPHRDPFLFIDTVKEITLPDTLKDKKGPFTAQQMIGGKCICCFKVDHSVKVLEGHFPSGHDAWSGVFGARGPKRLSWLQRFCTNPWVPRDLVCQQPIDLALAGNRPSWLLIALRRVRRCGIRDASMKRRPSRKSETHFCICPLVGPAKWE